MRATRHFEELDLDYRKSPICSEHWTGNHASGPHAGAEALDAGPLERDGVGTTLFERLRGPRHKILLFAGTGDEVGRDRLLDTAEEFAARYAAHADVEPIVRPGDTQCVARGLTAAIDVSGDAHERYGASKPSIYVIRPDGYVGYRCTPPNPAGVDTYFARVLDATVADAG